MKTLLATLRKIPIINYPIRSFLRFGKKSFDRLISHWTVSGITNIKYDDVELKLFNRCDDGFVQTFYYETKYAESNVLIITDAFAKRSKTILDIGANTGIPSLIIAKKNPHLNIIAIEPYQPNYNRLEKNLSLNNVTNIDVRKVALGCKEDSLEFIVPSDGRISDVASATEGIGEKVYSELKWEKTKVQQVTLDSLNIPPIHFFKCDVEGFERNVFEGAINFFRSCRPTFIVEIVLTKESIEFFNDFAGRLGYTIYYLGEDGLIKINELYRIDWLGDFLFSVYNHSQIFIPSKDLVSFVNSACEKQTTMEIKK